MPSIHLQQRASMRPGASRALAGGSLGRLPLRPCLLPAAAVAGAQHASASQPTTFRVRQLSHSDDPAAAAAAAEMWGTVRRGLRGSGTADLPYTTYRAPAWASETAALLLTPHHAARQCTKVCPAHLHVNLRSCECEVKYLVYPVLRLPYIHWPGVRHTA